MATVLTWPNEALTQVAEPVEQGERCRELVDSMFDAMDYPNGIGLAAPQIGVNKRIIVIHVPAVRAGRAIGGGTKHAIINPEVVWAKGVNFDYEGCLSFPGQSVLVPRAMRVKVTGFDVRWNPITIGGKGLVARVLQHEIDHLDGRTLDYYIQMAEEAKQSKPIES